MNLTPTLRHLTALALLTGLCNNAFAWDQAKAVEEGIKAISAGKDPIPGPRSCFWARGPASADPYINIAYPDAATFYWAAVDRKSVV